MSRQRDPPAKPGAIRSVPMIDSPWFWAMLFCAAGMMVLLAMWPRYAARQRRLEMQYLAREEIVRRWAAGERAAREPGDEGAAPPPAAGELMIPIWPLWLLLAALFAVSAILLWQSRRRRAVAAGRSARAEPP